MVVVVMSEGLEKNLFSKAIEDLSAKKENALKQKKEEEDALAVAAARKLKEEQRLYVDWLEKAEEIFVGDCFEAIGNISGEDFAVARSGTVSFSSEAFIWFRERSHPTPMVRPMKVKDLTQSQKRHLAGEGNAWRLHYDSSHPNRIQVDREIQQRLTNHSAVAWSDKKVGKIYDRIRRELTKENFDLVTEDGVEFVLRWSSK